MTKYEKDMEAEANLFARLLLMPEAAVREWLSKNPVDLADDKKLALMADYFMVPMVIVGIRLKDLGLCRGG